MYIPHGFIPGQNFFQELVAPILKIDNIQIDGDTINNIATNTRLNLAGNGTAGVNISNGPLEVANSTRITSAGDAYFGTVTASHTTTQSYFERSITESTGVYGALYIKLKTSGDMIDGFGPLFSFGIQDNSGIAYYPGSIHAVRDGADNMGKLIINANNSGNRTATCEFKPSGINLPSGKTIAINGVTTIKSDGSYVNKSDTTANRPSSPAVGQCYYDTTLNKPIWYNGSTWKDAAGTTV